MRFINSSRRGGASLDAAESWTSGVAAHSSAARMTGGNETASVEDSEAENTEKTKPTQKAE